MNPLSPKRRSELRAEAHKLSPVVIIGDKGLTDEVIAEIDRSLKAHELIKVRAATDERDARAVWIETICDRLQAHPVQQIGKVFVIYRENEDEAEKAQGTRRKAQEAEKGEGTGRKPRESERAQGTRRKALETKKAQDEKVQPKGRGAGRSRALRLAPDAPSSTRTSRQRSPAPSPRPASEPRRRRPRTSR
jgi:RNA-binding protein